MLIRCGTFTPDLPSDDDYPCYRNVEVPRTSWHARGHLLRRDECPLKDEKSATGDVVTSGIEFAEEREKYMASTKEVNAGKSKRRST